jgi:NTE family protein
MLTLVMSGAANYGAMQSGALEVLVEAGVRPRMAVGTSAGALNAIQIAYDPTIEGVRKLQAMWRAAGPNEVGVPKPLGAIRRLVRQRDSLVANEALTNFLGEHLPPGVDTFAQLEKYQAVRAYAIAVCVETGDLRAFGDLPEDRLLDGAMASTAVPPYFPPWLLGGLRYLDGGVYAKLPVHAAIQRGATQIIALDVTHAMGSKETAHGVLGISGYAISLMVEAQAKQEVAWAQMMGAVLRVIRLPAPTDISFWDYTQADRLIDIGREVTARELEQEPLRLYPRWWLRMRRGVAGLRARVS